VQGNTGAQGLNGVQGTTGAQGTQGVQGTTGAQGLEGIQGTTGAQGTQGLQGTTGSQGVQGVQGTTGSQGVQGTQGVQGIQGITGTGTQGATGAVAPRTINYVISGGGGTITTGASEAAQSKGYLYTSQQLVIDSWSLVANTSGSIKIDIWSGTYAAFPTMQLMSGSNPPQLATSQKNTGTNTGFTATVINAGNVIQFRVNSSPTVSVDQVTVVMNVVSP
jgi:hypothetical protein